MEKKKYKGIIFDLDGVLCSTDEFHYQAWRELAKRLDITNFTKEDNNLQRGVSRMESLEILLAKKPNVKYSDNEKKEFAEYKNEKYKELINQMTSKDADIEVINTIKKLKSQGYKLAIGSSSKNAKLILTRLNIIDYFDAISDGNNISHSKPNPEVFLKAAEMLGLNENECIVVEDAISGILAAHNGGFDSAGISNAASYEIATYKIQKLSDLLNIL